MPNSKEQLFSKFGGLISKNFVSEEKLSGILDEAVSSDVYPETLLMERGVPKHEILRCLSEENHLPIMEFDERIIADKELIAGLDMEGLKKSMWFPLSSNQNQADVLVCDPKNPALDEEIKALLNVNGLKKSVALPSDLIRIIENNQDANPHFPASAGRTVLARLRTYLSGLRTLMADHRTSMAKGRTGLAMMRTGISFSAVILVLIKIFGIGYFIIPEVLILIMGLVFLIEGLKWYLPIRRLANRKPSYKTTESAFGSSFLEMTETGGKPAVVRTGPIEGSDTLRLGWNRLSTVMKRRFLAIDRTDLAGERTGLASYRTAMAQARTGLAFTRTGIAFIGLGIGLFRQFPLSGWTAFYLGLILVGVVMTLEGFHWYVPGRQAGKEGLKLIETRQKKTFIWDFMFNVFREQLKTGELPSTLFIKESHSPGIWGTTGLALERTLIAERRNVKARLRTIMARSRTGMAFIRTGMKVFAVGLGLLVYFGMANKMWMVCDISLIVLGVILIADGFSWYIPAERTKNHLPYCFADMEILMPDYSTPTLFWRKVVFSHHEL